MTDEENEAAVRDDPDAAPICDEAWFERAELVIPAHLKHLWVQIDEDLMAWFREQGEGWSAKINVALREYVDVRRKRRKGAKEPAGAPSQSRFRLLHPATSAGGSVGLLAGSGRMRRRTSSPGRRGGRSAI